MADTILPSSHWFRVFVLESILRFRTPPLSGAARYGNFLCMTSPYIIVSFVVSQLKLFCPASPLQLLLRLSAFMFFPAAHHLLT